MIDYAKSKPPKSQDHGLPSLIPGFVRQINMNMGGTSFKNRSLVTNGRGKRHQSYFPLFISDVSLP